MECSVTVLVIAGFFMAINGPIEEVDHLILEARDADTTGVKVERHVFVTPDVHEFIIHLQQGVREWSFLEVSPKLVHVHIFFINLKLLKACWIKN